MSRTGLQVAVLSSIVVMCVSAMTWADPPQPAPCFTLTPKSCAGAWANTSRVCRSGAVAIACEDIVLSDSTFNSVKLGSGKSEYTNDSPVSTYYIAYECGSAQQGQPVCNYLGYQTKQCIGKKLEGYECEGGGPV